MKLYKLTDADGQTRGNTQWGPGVTHAATGKGAGLCSDGWIHAYEHPLLAVLLNPAHANFVKPRLWEAEGEVGVRDGQLKCGCKSLTTVREIPLPKITAEARVKFAIGCALVVYHEKGFKKWAVNWLSGANRTLRMALGAVTAALRADSLAGMWAARAAEWAAGDTPNGGLSGASVCAARAAAEASVWWAHAINLIAIAEESCQ